MIIIKSLNYNITNNYNLITPIIQKLANNQVIVDISQGTALQLYTLNFNFIITDEKAKYYKIIINKNIKSPLLEITSNNISSTFSFKAPNSFDMYNIKIKLYNKHKSEVDSTTLANFIPEQITFTNYRSEILTQERTINAYAS